MKSKENNLGLKFFITQNQWSEIEWELKIMKYYFDICQTIAIQMLIS